MSITAILWASLACGAFGIVYLFIARNAIDAARHPEQHECVPGDWQ